MSGIRGIRGKTASRSKTGKATAEKTEKLDDELLPARPDPVDPVDPAEREMGIARTVAAAELEAAEPGPDDASNALMTSTLRSLGVRPILSDNPRGVTCPECGTPLVTAPRSGKEYVVCYSALGGEGGCWYYREMPAKAKEK